MSRKVGIIGMGHVGSTVAHGLIAQGAFDDYVLIDTNEKKVTADAVDFRDAAANLNQHANIVINDYEALADADVVISWEISNFKIIQMQTVLRSYLLQHKKCLWLLKS